MGGSRVSMSFLALGLCCALLSQEADAEFKVTIGKSAHPSALDPAPQQLGDVRYLCEPDAGRECGLKQFFGRLRVCGLIVLKDGEVALERYRDTLIPPPENDPRPFDERVCGEESSATNDEKRLYGIASVAKSITSTLLGEVLTRKGKLGLLDQAIDRTLEYLRADRSAGGYAYAFLDTILRMRSGVRSSDLAMYDEVENKDTRTKTYEAFAAEVPPTMTGRGRFNYLASDTEIAGLLTQVLAGKQLHAYLREGMAQEPKPPEGMWEYLGTEGDATWRVDKGDPPTPAAYCCFSATLRDLARFGRFVLERGRDPDGKQQIAPEWFDLATARAAGVDDSIPPDNLEHNAGCPLDYRYQWWLFPAPRTDFTAVGRSGQFIHVMPDDGLVIVQISDWGRWVDGNRRECETFRFHDAIAAALRE